MEGYGHTYGQERECPEVVEQKKFFAKVMEIIREDPKKEAARKQKSALIIAENMRKEYSFWLKYASCGFTFIVLYSVLIAIFG